MSEVDAGGLGAQKFEQSLTVKNAFPTFLNEHLLLNIFKHV